MQDGQKRVRMYGQDLSHDYENLKAPFRRFAGSTDLKVYCRLGRKDLWDVMEILSCGKILTLMNLTLQGWKCFCAFRWSS